MPKKLTDSRGGRFVLVGLAATAIDFAALLLLDSLTPLTAVTANIVATSIAFGFSFIANKNYTFRTSGSSLVREMVLFSIFTLFGLWVLQSLVIALVLPLLSGTLPSHEISLIGAKLVATGVSMVWNYLTYSRFVFVDKTKEN